MLVGRFGSTTGRPYLEGRLFFPRLRLAGDISFLIDTGADQTTIMPADNLRIGVDYASLTDKQENVGVGGLSQHYLEPAILVFLEENSRLVGYSATAGLAPQKPELMNVPSLLGRDILDQWKMTYDKSQPHLTFEINSVDFEAPIS